MVDGVRNNLALKQRLQEVQTPNQSAEQDAASSPRSFGQSHNMHDETPKHHSIGAVLHRAELGDCTLKGILKAPRVRFTVDTVVPEEVVRPFAPPIHPPPPPPPAGMEFQSLLSPPIVFLPPPAPPSPPPPQHNQAHVAPPPPNEPPRPPSIYNKQIELDKYLSEPALDLYNRFLSELSEFVAQQGEVIKQRLAVQEKRTELKQLREEVSRCDIAFIDHVRYCVAMKESVDNPQMIALFDEAQLARDHVGPCEAEYEPMEVDLGAEESKLKDKYADLEAHFEQFFSLSTNPPLEESKAPEIQYVESSASSASESKVEPILEPRDISPFHGAWIGDQVVVGQEPVRAEDTIVERVQRRQIEIRRKRSKHSSEEQSKRRLSSATAEDRAQDELSADLKGITGTNDGDLIPSNYLQRGIGDILQSLTGASIDIDPTSNDDLSSFPDDIPLDTSLQQSDSLLLSALPLELALSLDDYLEAFHVRQAPLHGYLAKFESTRDRVNLWMLHQLRLSRREMYELQRQVLIFAPEVVQWAEIAVEEWSNDGLGQGQTYIAGSIERASDKSVPAAHHVGAKDVFEQGVGERIIGRAELLSYDGPVSAGSVMES